MTSIGEGLAWIKAVLDVFGVFELFMVALSIIIILSLVRTALTLLR